MSWYGTKRCVQCMKEAKIYADEGFANVGYVIRSENRSKNEPRIKVWIGFCGYDHLIRTVNKTIHIGQLYGDWKPSMGMIKK